MNEIKINVTDKRAQVMGAPVIVCGNVGYTVNFTFDDEWSAHDTKTARFSYRKNGAEQYQDVVFTGSLVDVPVLSDVHEVRIGVFAGNLYTSTPARVPCELSIRCGTGAPEDPAPDVYDQVMQEFNRMAPRIGENGNWYKGNMDTGVKAQGEPGPQGDPGPKGDPGDTYKLTSDDKWDIAAILKTYGVRSAQPDWNQNDPEADDYVKNRPCYKIPTYLLEETELEFSDMGGLFANVMEMSIPSETETIVVNFDGTDYKVYLAWNNDRTEASCGNAGLIGGIDSGEPFAAMLEGSMFALIVLPGTTSARVSIRTEIIKTLDTDFVPPESTVQTFDLTGIGTIQHGEFTRNNDLTEPLFESIIKAIRVKGSVQFKVKITAKLYCQVESDGTGAKAYQDEEITVFMTPARISEDENGNRSCRLYSYLNGYVLEMFLAPYLVCAGLLKFTDMKYYS